MPNEPPAASTTAFGVDLNVTDGALAMVLQAVITEIEQRQRGFLDGVKARLPPEHDGLVAEAAHGFLLTLQQRRGHG